MSLEAGNHVLIRGASHEEFLQQLINYSAGEGLLGCDAWHYVTTQKTTWIFIAVNTSNLAQRFQKIRLWPTWWYYLGIWD